ncbi:acyltransferase-like protein [Senna tora]|uniref:Acyltransferase-like protein n=1 Tax=Senna tora TaxID=362788 RepID=A0A834T9Z5_9FABA|nr:acyltransferase-like protein [Senna tora]
MASALMGIVVPPFSAVNLGMKHRCGAQSRSLEGEVSLIVEEGNGIRSGYGVKKMRKTKFEELEALWDDGYGTQTVQDYFEAAKEMNNVSDGGPPRWFSPLQCGRPLKDSPTLFFLPGMDGTGLTLTLHHKALGKVFEVRCMHIPVHDRTPLEGIYNVEAKLALELVKILPKDTLIWKLKLIKSAAEYANSRLEAVKAQDNLLPSGDEAKRLARSLQNCKIRYFENNGHTLLLEDGLGLLTIIKGTGMYRPWRNLDLATDFIPPSMTEFNYARHQIAGAYTPITTYWDGRLFRSIVGSVMFSTMEDGQIVKGLGGVPDEGPVLLVGYHMLLGSEIISIIEEFLSEKGIMVRGLAHPQLFTGLEMFESLTPSTFSVLDWGKDEKYKLIWPNRQEFVRMAAHFGATIVPFGVVGEDDITEMLLDYNDLKEIPIVKDIIRYASHNIVKIRDESSGEVANQNFAIPVLLPKLPGRFYYLFGKPIRTKGREKMLKDKKNAEQVYLQVKSEIERSITYLIKKREEDPYRNLIDRKLYEAINPSHAPTFDP